MKQKQKKLEKQNQSKEKAWKNKKEVREEESEYREEEIIANSAEGFLIFIFTKKFANKFMKVS